MRKRALGIAPEIVSGTSIGALVGAAFATDRLAALKARMENFGKRDTAGMRDLRLASGGLIEGRRVEPARRLFLSDAGGVWDQQARRLSNAAQFRDAGAHGRRRSGLHLRAA